MRRSALDPPSAEVGVSAFGAGRVLSSGSPALSFIVPAFEAASTLRAAVTAIRAAAPVSSEVIVVDDGSFDDTAALAGAVADLVVERPCQGGAARARNDGAQVARGATLFFVDADVTVTPAAVAGALCHLEAGADAVFGAYQPFPPPAVANVATTCKNLLHHYTHLRGAGEASTFWSGFGAIRRDAFFGVSGFDPAVTAGADVEDIHLGYRLRAAGYRIVLDPSLQVAHHKRYTVRGLVASDLFHRAIPWTRAMLEQRTFHADLNFRKPALGSAVLANGAVLCVLAALVVGPVALIAAAALTVLWLAAEHPYLSYVRRTWNLRGTICAAALLFLYFLYGPIGLVLGVARHALRRRDEPPLLALTVLDPPTSAPLEVTVAVVLSAGQGLAVVDALPSQDPSWELLVVAEHEPPGLTAPTKFIPAPPGVSNAVMRQLALEAARGTMFAVLDGSVAPDPNWLERVFQASKGRDLMVAGSFSHVRRSGAARANQLLRYWQWRPERQARWLIDHPPVNVAWRTAAARALGGVADDGLSRRLAAFGARPVCFDPAMSVQVRAPLTVRSFLWEAARSSRAWMAAIVRGRRTPWLGRVALLALAPMLAAASLGRRIVGSVREGNADRGFWLSLPLICLGYVAAALGALAGLARPGAGPVLPS